ncbi:MAG: hypothetical protein H8D71_02455 [Deltaproteobacteria bacterium]|nr:hypothetical protein [Deltaproteobacteria bacterium]
MNETEVNIDDYGVFIKVELCIVDGNLDVEVPDSHFIEAGNILSGRFLSVHAEDFAFRRFSAKSKADGKAATWTPPCTVAATAAFMMRKLSIGNPLVAGDERQARTSGVHPVLAVGAG